MSAPACPRCGRDVGLWSVVRALSPRTIRCPHCKTLLCFRSIKGVMVCYALAMFSLVLSPLAIVAAGIDIPGSLFVVLPLAGVAGVEVVTAYYLWRTRRLEPTTPSGRAR